QLPRWPELVEQTGLIAKHPRWQDVALIDGPRQEDAFELRDDLEQAVRRAGFAADAMPGRQKSRERHARDRLDFASQSSQRAPAQRAQDVRITPLAFSTTRTELAAQDAAGRFHAPERVVHQRRG